MIERKDILQQVSSGLAERPITALMGPRQCGKTTLARSIAQRFPGSVYLDLEDPEDDARLQNPKLALSPLSGLVILDEIQRRPDILPLLRVLADRRPIPCRFLILGSASPTLMKGSSETLAGRVRFVDMAGLVLAETGYEYQRQLWWRGGFPDSFLAPTEKSSVQWREDFIRTFLERDLVQLGVKVSPATLRRFWTMTAHYHGQTWNASEIAGSLGVSHQSTRHYLDILTAAYVIRELPPWFENMGKRVVKAPKIYIRDSGIFHTLLGLSSMESLESHPKLGASWEGFAIEQILHWTGERNAYFWATHGGAELDLMILSNGQRWGFEFKYQDAPKMTKSMHLALQDLSLERLWVIYPGDKSYDMDDRVQCVPLAELERIRTIVAPAK